MATKSICVVGGGPAGLMTGVLLARQGLPVTVLEKHVDFLRDFRGDTIHPSTLQILHELGWLEDFLKLPHAKMAKVEAKIGRYRATFADFSRLRVAAPYIAFAPQWDFLSFLATKASAYPTFSFRPRREVTGLRRAAGRVVGVEIAGPEGDEVLLADLVIGADGRRSTVRANAGLTAHEISAPLDVLWLRLPRRPDEHVPFFQGGNGALICIDRGDYWQIAFAFPARTSDELRAKGIAEFRRRLARFVPAFEDRLGAVTGWDQLHQLNVRVDRLPVWHRPGALCIGDAAHAMSPAGGVGINLAIQDAVATANILGPILRSEADLSALDKQLDKVRRRRELPVRVIQALQTRLLRNVYPRSLDDDTAVHPPLALRLFETFPPLRHLTGRLIGLGVRPEHVAEFDSR